MSIVVIDDNRISRYYGLSYSIVNKAIGLVSVFSVAFNFPYDPLGLQCVISQVLKSFTYVQLSHVSLCHVQ